MTAAIVITAMFGNHDEPPRAPVDQDIEVEWLYYTDSSEEAAEPWSTHRVVQRFENPNLSAKLYKCCPPVEEADTVWIDANMEITSPTFVREALAARSTDGIAAWLHPRRDDVYDEAEASVGAEAQGGKYDGFDLAAQVASYHAEGYPTHGGLFACGTIAWNLENPVARGVGADWLDECRRWSPQDQLSFPVVCWRHRVIVGVFPFGQIDRRLSRGQPYLANRWLRIWPHRTREPA